MSAIGETLGAEAERNVLALIDKLESCKRDISLLKEENERLEMQLRKAHADLVSLQGKYDNLQLAQAGIRLAKGDIKTARKQVSSIINQIDNCIAALNSE